MGRPKSYDRSLANANAIFHFDALEAPDRIICLTLIIGGSDNRIVGIRASHEMCARIPGSRLFINPSLGHAARSQRFQSARV